MHSCFYESASLSENPRCVRHEVTIDLLYFWDVYDVNLRAEIRQKCCLFMQNKYLNYLYNLIVLRKNNRHRWDILNQWESMGFPEMCLFSCLELSYGTSIQEDSIQFMNSQMLLS